MYPYTRRRQPWQARTKSAKKAHPQFIFTGVRLALGTNHHRNSIWFAPDAKADLSALLTILYYEDGRCLALPAKPEDMPSGHILGEARYNRGDRIVWSLPNSGLCIYVTLLTDVENAATKFFSPASKAMLAAGKSATASILDALVPYEETIANFCDGILGLFERGCQAKTCACKAHCDHEPMLSIDDVEGDYKRMQKLLSLLERGSTKGERAAAVARVEEQVGKLFNRIAGDSRW